MSPSRTCPTCGARFEAHEAEGAVCPACLLGGALEVPAESGLPQARGTLEVGDCVGAYRILETIGEGGMGEVFLAEGDAPMRRRVALKVIKRGMETRQVLARFQAERDALVRMNHPSIVAVHDAGETADGLPYLVMEHVDGVPIHRYCDEARLSMGERLGLFQDVCEAIQHAHRKGVVHRDIKPSNVLIAEVDGARRVKVIDFGVAKLVERERAERSLFTELGMLVGTPEYMSPEQAALSPVDVDTRTDVYSLGVLLYELLIGTLPFDSKELRAGGYDEILRRIRQTRPSRPSTRITELGDSAGETARSRRLDVSALQRRLRGDLDVITMKALEKEPERRYESPAELAADLGRHLRGEPVLARPPSAGYLLGRFVARHRVATALAASLVLLSIGFGVWMTLLYRDSQRNLARALDAEAEAAQVSDFLIGVFEVSDPDQSKGEETTARELLDAARERIATQLSERPALRARLLSTLGEVYGSLGLYSPSSELHREALDLRLADDSSGAQARGSSLARLAKAEYRLGRFEPANELAERALATLGEEASEPELEAAAHDVLMHVLWDQGRYDEALVRGQRVFDLRVAAFGPRHDLVADSWLSLSHVHLALSAFDEAEAAARSALKLMRDLHGEDHPGAFRVLNNLAEIYRRQARYDEAEQLFLEIQAGERRVFDDDHALRAFAFNNLGLVYRRQGRLDEAVGQFREALRIRELALPAQHPLLAWTWDNLGLTLLDLKRFDEAGAAFETARTIALAAVGPRSPDYAVLLNNSALLARDLGKIDEAESLWLEAIGIYEEVLGDSHTRLADPLYNLAKLVRDAGRRDDAIALFQRSLDITDQAYGPEHPDSVDTRRQIELTREAADTG